MADQKFEVNCGFFDSVDKDRLYTADEMNRPYKRVISNGVFATSHGTASTDLQVVSAGDGLNIIVKKGEGLFGDKWFENPSDLAIAVSSNTNVAPRRDSIIIQVDKRTSGRTGSIVYREGTASSNPQPPDIGTVDNVIEYRLANIYVAAGATTIAQSVITDLRGSSDCPWITSLVDQVDTSTLFAQYQAAYESYYDESTEEFENYFAVQKTAFDEFMASLTEELSVSTTLVTYDSSYTTTEESETLIPINIPSYNKDADILFVFINGLRATTTVDYSIADDGQSITLTKSLNADQAINFLVLQSVLIGNPETVISKIQELDQKMAPLLNDTDWADLTLSSMAASETGAPAVRRVGYTVHLRGSLTNIGAVGSIISTLPAAMWPEVEHSFTAAAVASDGTIEGFCVFSIDALGELTLTAISGAVSSAASCSVATSYLVG